MSDTDPGSEGRASARPKINSVATSKKWDVQKHIPPGEEEADVRKHVPPTK
jgi:hypothetical protein